MVYISGKAETDSPVPDSPFQDYLDLVEAARELGIHPQSLRDRKSTRLNSSH